MMWLLNVDPAVLERERFRTSTALRDEIPGCAVDRDRQAAWHEDNMRMRREARDAVMIENQAAVARQVQAVQAAYKKRQARRNAGPELLEAA